MLLKNIFIILAFAIFNNTFGQIELKRDTTENKTYNFDFRDVIIPTFTISYGIIKFNNYHLKRLDSYAKNNFKYRYNKFPIDDYTQYSQFTAVYLLNALGVEGRHDFRDRTLILGTAYAIMGSTVLAIKKTTKVLRPDNSSYNSFPSGHTATSFMGAEFLYQEYKDVSIWYGVAGYIIAATTGYLRVFNNRHWISDVVAGAGVGILSTKAAYWLYPFLNKNLFRNSNIKGIAMPYYNGNEIGVGIALTI